MAKPLPRAATPISSVTNAANATKQALCDHVAALLLPDDRIGPQVDRFVSVGVDAMMRGDPGIAEMERTYPGLVAAMKIAWKPVMLKFAMQNVTPYRADLSQLYCAHLTVVDLRQTLAFLQTPEYGALKISVQDNIDYTHIAKDMTNANGVSARSIKGDLGDAGVRAIATLTPAQKAKVAAFFSSPTGRKLLALNPEKIELDRKWSNYVSPEAEAEIKQVTADTMIGHIGKTDPEAAARLRKELEREGF